MLAYGLLGALLAAGLILYADALFRFELAFRVKAPERAEPRGWELFSRVVGQTALTICALACYLLCFIHL